MKRAVSLLFILTVLLVFFSGCSFKLRSIESLMRPPYTATERELEKSIHKLLGTHISYRSPSSGKYFSAITLRDLNGDSVDEAVVFYVNKDDESTVRMCVLSQSEGEWNLVSDFAGNGSSVISLDFVDFNNDFNEEIIVSWLLFGDKAQKMISIYTSDSENDKLKVSACISEPYDIMMVTDVNGNNEKQILISFTSLTQSLGKTTLKMLGVNVDNKAVLINETILDERISKTVAINSDLQSDGQLPRFFIDAQISDSQFITHVFEWNSESKNFISLIDDFTDRDITLRSSNLLCKDINDDGQIEIPLRKPMAESNNSDNTFGYVLEWCSIKDSKLVTEVYYVVNLLENYNLYFPSSWKDKVFINTEIDTRTWNFLDKNNNKLFSVTAYNFSEWDENSSNVTEMLMMQNDTVYACTITEDGANFGIKAVDLLKYFSLNV